MTTSQPTQPRFLLSIKETARRLNVSPSTVRRLMENSDPERRLPYSEIGGQIRIPSDWLDAYIERRAYRGEAQ